MQFSLIVVLSSNNNNIADYCMLHVDSTYIPSTHTYLLNTLLEKMSSCEFEHPTQYHSSLLLSPFFLICEKGEHGASSRILISLNETNIFFLYQKFFSPCIIAPQ